MSRSSEPVAVNRAAVNGSATKSLSWYFPLSNGSGPRGTRTHNPRIKRGGHGVRVSPCTAGRFRARLLQFAVIGGGCRHGCRQEFVYEFWQALFRLKGGASTVSGSARDESTDANRLGIWQGRPQRQAPAKRLVLVTKATHNVGEPAPQKKPRSPRYRCRNELRERCPYQGAAIRSS